MILVPALHPAALLRGRGDDTANLAKYEQTTIADIAKAVRFTHQRPQWDERAIYERDAAGRLICLFPTVEEVERFCLAAEGFPLALDTETTGESTLDCRLLCCGFASANGSVMCVPFLRRGGARYWSPYDEVRVRAAVGKLLASARTPKVIHNKAFDEIVLWSNGLPVMGEVFCCYVDSETEFLTERGWKKYDDVKKGDRLATVAKDGTLEYQPFFDRISRQYEGDIYTFETPHSRAVVTANHRMLCRPFYRQRPQPIGEWEFRRADAFVGQKPDQFDVRVAFEDAKPEPNERTVAWQDDVRFDEDRAILLGLWITDGTLQWEPGVRPHSAVWTQSATGPAIDELRRLAVRFGLKEHAYTKKKLRKRRGGKPYSKQVTECMFIRFDPELAANLLRWCGRYSPLRRLPAFVFRWPRVTREALLRGLLLGDSGLVHGRRVYRTSCEGLAGDVQALALSLGYAASIHWAGDCFGVTLWRRKLDRAGARFTTGKRAARQNITKRKGSTRVVCFSVPNETLVTRSRGKPAFYGNTMQAHHCVDAELPNGLGYCGTRHLDIRYWKDDVKGDEGWIDMDETTLRLYNLRDCLVALRLMPIFSAELSKYSLWPLFHEEQALASLMARATIRGLCVDFVRRDGGQEWNEKTKAWEQVKGLGPQLREQMNNALALLKYVAGDTGFDPMKPTAVRQLLFDRLRLPVVKMAASGAHPSTDKEAMVLLALAADNDWQRAGIKGLADFRTAQKYLSTFVEGLPVLSDQALHASWRLLTVSGRFSSSPNCFDRETEILTLRGWMNGYDLQSDDRVAQWTTDGRVEFVQPTHVFYSTSNSLVHLKRQQHIDLAVTPDHRCLLRHRKTGQLRVFRGDEYPQDWQQIQAGLYSGPGVPYSLDEIRLAVAIQADGITSALRAGRLRVGFSKARKVDRYEALLKRLGAQYKKTEQYNLPDRPYRCWFQTEPCVLADKVQALLGSEKVFGAWVLQMNREQLDAFVEEVWYWDGCATRKNHYSSSIKSNTEWVQVALALSGFRTGLREYKSVTGRSNWQTDVTRKDYSLTTNVEKTIVEGPAPVWCVEVPSSYVVVRRNGRIAVTGNCQNWGKKIKKIFRAHDGCKFVGADLSQAELRAIAYFANDRRLLEMYRRGLNIHTVNLAMSLRVRPPMGHKDLDSATEQYIREQMPVLLGPQADFSQLIEMKGDALKGARTLIKNDTFGRNYGAIEDTVFSVLRSKRDADTNELLFPGLLRSEVEANGVMWRKLNVDIMKWWVDIQNSVKAKGYYRDPFSGRMHWFRAGFKQNDILNRPIQGIIASIVNRRMLEIQAVYDSETAGACLIVQQVHDAVNAESPDGYENRAAQVMNEVLSQPVDLPGHPGATFPPDPALIGTHLDQV